MIVPGGGFDLAGSWRPSKHNGTFLFPVKAMSKVLKHKFMEGLLKSMRASNESFDKEVRKTESSREWVVYAKRPYGGPKQVIEYLGRYTHKIAVSNPRIKNIENGKVTFGYKDYADNSLQKEMVLGATQFLRRFCLHILPKGFRTVTVMLPHPAPSRCIGAAYRSPNKRNRKNGRRWPKKSCTTMWMCDRVAKEATWLPCLLLMQMAHLTAY